MKIYETDNTYEITLEILKMLLLNSKNLKN